MIYWIYLMKIRPDILIFPKGPRSSSTKPDIRTHVSAATQRAGVAETPGGQTGQADPRQAFGEGNGTHGPRAADGVQVGLGAAHRAALSQA